MIYTVLLTGFGIKAIKRWGFDRKDRFQIWRYTSLIGFQIVFFCLIPEFLFRALASTAAPQNPQLAAEAWRSYGIAYAWPLAFYTFFGNPHDIWLVWGVLLSFVVLPVMALFHGKRYCSWICGCGGLAETVGDRWRHLAPKGRSSIRWERMNSVVLLLAVVITASVVAADLFQFVRRPANLALHWYHMVVEVWLSAIIPIALYPFLGGKIWCRYWCPLAKLIELFSAAFSRKGVSRFAIHANEKCIACGDCTRYCQVGIDVMRYALKQETLTNANSSCIGCGICVTVCPMDVLSFKPHQASELVQIQAAAR
jgi:polyferredoxin